MCSVDEIVTSPLSPRFPCHVLRKNIWAIDDHKLSIEKEATRTQRGRKVSPPKSTDDCKTQRIAKVKFETVVEVRSYNTVLGDNPSVGQGPPVSLGWEYTTKNELMEDDSDNHQKKLPIAYYQLDALSRRDRLQQNGISKQEVDDAVVEVDRIKRSRVIRSTIIAVNRTSLASLETTKKVGSLTWAVTPTKRSRRAAPRTRINTPYPRPRSMDLPCQ